MDLENLRYKIQFKGLEINELQKRYRYLTGQYFTPSGPLPQSKEKSIRCLEDATEVLLDQLRYPASDASKQLINVAGSFQSAMFWGKIYKDKLRQKVALMKQAQVDACMVHHLIIDDTDYEYQIDENGDVELMGGLPESEMDRMAIAAVCLANFEDKITEAAETRAADMGMERGAA